MTIRILLAEDHPLYRDALRGLLARSEGHEIVAETGDGAAVVALAIESAADVVCLDIGMPGRDGVSIARDLRSSLPAAKVIALSTYAEHRYVADMLAAGATAYVCKSDAPDELLRALDAVRRDGLYLSPTVAGAIEQAATEPAARPLPHASLGNREREVLRLVASGLTSAQVAAKLHIAPSTAEAHRRNVMRKLDLHSVADLTRYAIRVGLVSA